MTTIRVVKNQERPEEFVTSWLSHENFKTYHLPTARFLGSVNAAIVLSDLIAYRKYYKDTGKLKSHPKYGDGWVPYSIEKCDERTAISRKEQDTVFSILLKNKLVEKVVFNVPGERHFRIKFLECEELIISNNVSRMPETGKLECPKRAKYNAQKGQTYNNDYEMTYEMSKEYIRKSEHVELTQQEYDELVQAYGKPLVEQKILAMEARCMNKRNGKAYKHSASELKSWCEIQKQQPHASQASYKSPEQKNRSYIAEIVKNNPHLVENNTLYVTPRYVELNDGKNIKSLDYKKDPIEEIILSWSKATGVKFVMPEIKHIEPQI